MSDFADEAHEFEEAARAEALQRATAVLRGPVNIAGVCRTCGEDIDPRRLEAMPSAVQCIHCAIGEQHGR